jgi:hypothetical protein
MLSVQLSCASEMIWRAMCDFKNSRLIESRPAPYGLLIATFTFVLLTPEALPMTTKLYMCILASVCAGFALCVALLTGLKMSSEKTPARPTRMPTSAVWRPTPSESVVLWPHGDWVNCRDEGTRDHCTLTDATGETEYDGYFVPLPGDGSVAVPNGRLRPVTSDTISPWMWSKHANRLVPIVQMEDGTVLTPAESVEDLRAYVERMQKLTARPIQVPVYLEYHPAGSPYLSQK